MFEMVADQPKPSPVFNFDITGDSVFGSSARCDTIIEEEKESTFSSKPKLFRPSLTNKYDSDATSDLLRRKSVPAPHTIKNGRLETELDDSNTSQDQ